MGNENLKKWKIVPGTVLGRSFIYEGDELVCGPVFSLHADLIIEAHNAAMKSQAAEIEKLEKKIKAQEKEYIRMVEWGGRAT